MQWTDEIRLETPEQIGVDVELAGLGTRFVAQMLDWVIKVLVSAALVVAALVAAALLNVVPDVSRAPPLLAALAVGGLYLLWLGFDIYYEAVHNGQTPGKRHAGIRVIREGGAPVDFQAAAVRNLLGLADYLPSFYVLGAVLVLMTARRQRLGDLAAGTIVVRERALTAPEEVTGLVEALAADEHRFAPRHLAACPPADLHVLRSFLQRWAEMDRGGRNDLARRLAQTFLAKTGYEPARPLQTGADAAAFLAALYRDLEEHRRRGD